MITSAGRPLVSVQSGDFCCLPVNGDAGALIRLGEWLNGSKFTQYQHAAIWLAPGSPNAPTGSAPNGWLFAAHPNGATYTTCPAQPENLPGALWSSGVIAVTDVQRALIEAACAGMRGTPYGWVDYAALAAHRLHVPIPGVESIVTNTHSMICSQLVDYVYSNAGIKLFDDGRWNGYVTPADLAWVIEKGIKR